MDKAHLIIYLAVLASIVSVLITCCLLYLIRDRLSKLFSKNTLLKIKKFLKENVISHQDQKKIILTQHIDLRQELCTIAEATKPS